MFRRHWRTGGRWVFWNGVGMVGLWGVGWVAFLFLVDTPWSELVDRGQFFLYSVGTLVQVMYLLTKDKKITTFPQRSLLTSISVLFLMMCAVLFGATVLSNLTEITVVESKVGWLRWSGVGIFLASMLVGVRSDHRS